MFEKSILHLDLDSFFVSVERLQNSQLNQRPVIIGGASNRGVVASCSYEARYYGVRSAMPMRTALKLCPQATVLRGDMDTYIKYSTLITQIIKDQAPLFEKSSIDEFFLDLSGMDRYIGTHKWAVELKNTILKESGLVVSCGLSKNKTVSKVGTNESKPNGFRYIEPGSEKMFLAPLHVSKMPYIGKITTKKLAYMGIKTIQLLSQVPPKLLQREFGKSGISMWKKANGIDPSPVVPYTEKKSISSETTFATDTIDIRYLKDKITALVTKLAFELRRKNKLTAQVSLKIRYSDFNTYSKQINIAYTATDLTLIKTAHRLLDDLYQRRVLVRLVGIKFSKLVHGSPQTSLFNNSAKELKLINTLDQIKLRFGHKAIHRANTLGTKKR